MPEIKAISKNSVHQICSGQVILDLTTAVKELVENSLDASAKSVEVKLKEYGLDQVEVIDNGLGVEEDNFEALTLKHHTSKLRDFGDLVSVQTFGFRGEALSSLCALCNVTVHTRHKSSSIGYKLEFDHDGLIKEKTKIARQIGTTVLLTNLFKTLPVRQKEFKRNIKKEYTKLLNIMSAYCLISTQARISCSNQTSKGQRVTVLSTQANCGLEQNIISLFTSKQQKDLIPFKQLPPNEQVCEEYNLKHSEAVELAASYKISGYLSNTCNRTGRSSPDRQFFFINSRPVDLPKVGKIVNQIYHQHLNRHRYPFVLLNIEMERSKVDVNVTPNKRKVFVEHEKLILAIVKTSLLAIYVDDERDIASLSSPSSTPSTSKNGSQLGYMNNLELNRTINSDLLDSSFQSDGGTLKEDFLAAFRRTSSNRKRPSTSCARKKEEMKKDNNKQSRLDSFSIAEFAHRRQNNSKMAFEDEEEMMQDAPLIPQPPKQSSQSSTTKISESTVESDTPIESLPVNHHEPDETTTDIMTSSPAVTSSDRRVAAPDKPIWTMHGIASSQFQTLSPISKIKEKINNNDDEEKAVEEKSAEDEEPATFDDDDEEDGTDDKCVREVAFSMSKIRSFVSRSKETAQKNKESLDKSTCFLAKIQPSQNDSAEKELSRNLSKTSFTCMKPLGQFNLGFIIAQLGTDLFIVDQHASDEIYNFEKLQETTTIHQQHLVVPKKLNLSAAEKMILTENKQIFERNGFDFITKVEDDRDVVYLTRIPMSGEHEFGSEDVDELIFLLSDASGVMCRPSSITKMFASRACRKSVMIGTALSEREMTRLLHHMADIERPWNCPHGRPTMRHLIDLNRVTKKMAE